MFRVLKISAALALIGAVAGAIGGFLALGLAVIVGTLTISASTEVPFSFVADAVTLVGSGCGVFVAPVLSWTLLRNVPIWRCATETAFATSFAGILALFFTHGNPWQLLAIALLGGALATARLKWAFRRRSAP
jgi:hypothetical protein